MSQLPKQTTGTVSLGNMSVEIEPNDGGSLPATWKRVDKEVWVEHKARPWLGSMRVHWATPEVAACEQRPDLMLMVFRRKYLKPAIRPFNADTRPPCEWVDPPVFLWEDLTEINDE